MLLNTRGIVFRAVKYGETSVITDIFTEEQGLHAFIAGGVRKAKSSMPFGLFQSMMVVDLVAYFQERSHGLNRLKECRSSQVFSAIPFDIRRGAVALFMAEICRKSIHEAEPNRELFDFLLDNLIWLDSTPYPIANLHLHFLLHLTAFLGFQPQAELDAGEVFFDLKEGEFSPVQPVHPLYLDPDDAARLLELLSVPVQEAHLVALTRAERKSLLQRLLQFYQLHMPGFSDVHTPDILDMVME